MQGCRVQRHGCKGKDIVHRVCEGIFLINKDTHRDILSTEMVMLARVGGGLGGPGSAVGLASSSCRKQRDGARELDVDHVTGCIRMDYGSV